MNFHINIYLLTYYSIIYYLIKSVTRFLFKYTHYIIKLYKLCYEILLTNYLNFANYHLQFTHYLF